MARILINIRLWRSHSHLVPSTLARARRAYPSQAQLGYAGADRSAPHLVNQVQTSNKAHDKFVPRRDCAYADRSRPSLSSALLSGWSPPLVNHHPRQPSRQSLRFEHALSQGLFARGW